VPGRKTDVRDSEWLQDLMQHGLVRGSFIPPAPIRELRDLTRHRANLVQDRTRAINRIHKLLEDANIKLAAVASDLLGVSGRLMLEALIAGETDAAKLAALAKGALRSKLAALEQALAGQVRPHHRLLLRELLDQVNYLDRSVERLNAAIAERTEPYAAALELLCSIAGVKGRVAEVILAEVGPDMGAFPSARHLCSWAALCPGNRESAGKRLSGRTRHGNRWLRAALFQAAWAAARSRDSYLAAQFRRIAKRRGEKRAVVAVAHSLLTIVYHVPERGVFYEELGADYFDRQDPDRLARYHARRLAELGYEVSMQPKPAA
jgi:transposase